MKTYITIILIALSFVSLNINAKTYTPTELNRMISAGKYPAQGKAQATSKPMSFIACKTIADKVIGDIKAYYPTDVVVNTEIMYMVKAWTNDAAVTITCSTLDNKMVMTQAYYK